MKRLGTNFCQKIFIIFFFCVFLHIFNGWSFCPHAVVDHAILSSCLRVCVCLCILLLRLLDLEMVSHHSCLYVWWLMREREQKRGRMLQWQRPTMDRKGECCWRCWEYVPPVMECVLCLIQITNMEYLANIYAHTWCLSVRLTSMNVLFILFEAGAWPTCRLGAICSDVV